MAVLEREVKLTVGDSFVVPDLDGAVSGACAGSTEERPIRDTYFDTAGLRLARWGCTLRFRESEGWTVKIPVPCKRRVLSRIEIVVDGPAGRPPPVAIDLVRSLTRGAPVDEVARFETCRLARAWCGPDGQKIIELSDDSVQVQLADRVSTGWRELEVELAPDADESQLAEIVDRLEAAGAHVGDQVPKLVHAVGDLAGGPPDVVVADLVSDPTAREVVQAAIARSVRHLLLHVPAARVGEDIEGVHQARVATRCLRSDLRTFRPLIDYLWARALEDDLRWLTDDLGRVRDADVLLARLRASLDRNPGIEPVGAERVVDALKRQRSRDNATLLDHLSSERADELFDRLVDAARDPITAPQADDPAAVRLPGLVRKRWRRLRRAVDSLDAEPSIDDLHRVRILAKRIRYAAEAVAPAFGPEAKAFAKSVSGIQDRLGELNDAAVAEAWLACLAEASDGATAFTAGRLAQLTISEGLQLGDDWQRHYHKAFRRYQAWSP